MRTVTSLEPEDVQAYPRPPSLDLVLMPIRVMLGGEVVAEAERAFRVCETHHAPTYYLPRESVGAGVLTQAKGASFCEWKGTAAYWDVTGGGETRQRAAWSYPAPTQRFAPLTDHVAFYCALMEACFLAGVRATPQPGDFYGGWVTPNLAGTVKGGPGTRLW